MSSTLGGHQSSEKGGLTASRLPKASSASVKKTVFGFNARSSHRLVPPLSIGWTDGVDVGLGSSKCETLAGTMSSRLSGMDWRV